MRKIGSKFIVLLLCAAFILSGCSNSNTKKPQAKSSLPDRVENLEGEDMKEREGENEIEDEEEAEDEKEEDIYVQPEMKGEITVSSFIKDEFLTAAAQRFMDQYPGVTVTINYFSESPKAGDLEDYQSYLNTKIMTGKAEDIVFITFLPISKYSDMGAFEDLSGYISMTPEFNDENYFMNVLTSAMHF